MSSRSSSEPHIIDRSRFLALREFGPRNTIYDDGRKHRVGSVVVPVDGIASQLTQARLCHTCGYLHDGPDSAVERCRYCDTQFDGSNSEYPQRLLELPTVRTYPTDRISSEEEERSRFGYDITTHFKLDPAGTREISHAVSSSGETLLELTFAPSATIWMINNGWRSAGTVGFTLDGRRGNWLAAGQANSEPDPDQPSLEQPLSGVRPYVWDTKNLLLLKANQETPSRSSLSSLTYALSRGMQLEFQIEESELAAEHIGLGEHIQILLWEAAEGGIGVGERIIAEPMAMARVARRALELCHWDADTGLELDDHSSTPCAVACYQCLLTYANQREHPVIDRHSIKQFLMELAVSTTQSVTQGRSRSEHYEWLTAQTDPNSSLEAEFLHFLLAHGHRLPDPAQYRPSDDTFVQTDFYYERRGRNGVCVFVDGPHHYQPDQQARDSQVRAELEDQGFGIIVIRHDQSLADQVGQHAYVFGPGTDPYAPTQ